MLFICVILVLIIRVARLHGKYSYKFKMRMQLIVEVGTRTTTFPIEIFRQEIFSISTYVMFAWYIVSAWLFAEVYLWARPASENFGIIDEGRSVDLFILDRNILNVVVSAHERARLNERAVAFRAMFMLLGVVQSFLHLFSDWDRVPTPLRKVQINSKSAPTMVALDSPIIQLKRAAPSILQRLVWVSCLFPTLGFFIYLITPLRSIVWNFSFNTLRFVYFLPLKQKNHRTGFAPFVGFFFSLLIQTGLLILLWEFTNAAFGVYISEAPLKKGKPLTDDSKDPKGKDPNGSLITGLKSTKPFAKSSAFYELLLITLSFPERRKTIFTERASEKESTWVQTSKLCLEQITAITKRIDAVVKPEPKTPPPEPKLRDPIAQPLKQDNIFVPPPPALTSSAKMEVWTKSVAEKYGQSPGAKPLQNAIEWGGKKLLTDTQRAQLQPQAVEKRAEGVFDAVMKTPLGWPLRQNFERRVMKIICGSPYSMEGIIVDAADALARLVVEALKEDVYGQVQHSVVDIIKEYAKTIKSIEKFLKEAEPHWSDVEFKERDSGSIKEVNEIVRALKDGLGWMVGAYGEYLPAMGMSEKDIKDVKKALGDGASEKAVGGGENAKEKSEKAKGKERVPEMEEARS